MFELITALHLAPPDRATGRGHVPRAPWLADHFPETPLVPGTILLELAAQIAGPLAELAGSGAVHRSQTVSGGTGSGAVHRSQRGAVLGMVRSAVFRAPVPAPAEIEIAATIGRRDASAVSARVEVRHAAVVAMTAELVFALVDVADGPAWQARQARIARWQAAW